VYFVQVSPYRDKKVVSVFVRFFVRRFSMEDAEMQANDLMLTWKEILGNQNFRSRY
jgi:hypothetical protein